MNLSRRITIRSNLIRGYIFFSKGDNHYVLISADFLDFYYDHFPALLRFNKFEFKQIDFVLRREVNSINSEKTSGTLCFEYNKQVE